MPGKRAFGIQLEYSTTSGGTYTPIVGITTIKPFAQKADSMDVSSHDSPSSYREKVPTMLDNGMVTFDYNFNDADTTHRYIISNNGVMLYWKVIVPGTTPTTYSFQGFLNSNQPTGPFDNKMTAAATIEINGVVTTT